MLFHSVGGRDLLMLCYCHDGYGSMASLLILLFSAEQRSPFGNSIGIISSASASAGYSGI